MKFNKDNDYSSVYVTIKLSSEGNKLLSESCARSKRRKLQEAALRLEEHLREFESVSNIGGLLA